MDGAEVAVARPDCPPFPAHPGQRLHRRPDGDASSLGVIEEFFGVELNDEVIEQVRRLPAQQLAELRIRLLDNETAYRALFLDRVRRDDAPSGSRAEMLHIHEDSLASGLGYARTTDIANAPALNRRSRPGARCI